MTGPVVEQPALPGVPAPSPRKRTSKSPAGRGDVVAGELPIARVALDLEPPHLDRYFDYLVPREDDDAARPGVRVRVRFAGRQVSGYIVERAAASEHSPVPLRTVVSDEQVLTPEVLALARAVAARYAGTLADVLRLAVPPRHARVESEVWPEPVVAPMPGTEPGSGGGEGPAREPWPAASRSTSAWAELRGGPALLQRLTAGDGPRAVWTALPGRWAGAIAEAVAACRISGRGAVVVVPDGKRVDNVTRALTERGIEPWQPERPGGWVALQADDGPAPRYRAFLAALRGRADVVVGTRAAAFAPVAALGLAVCWEDGDPLHHEPRAPYPHVRDVLALRADIEGAGLVIGGFARSSAAQRLVDSGWAQPVAAARDVVRAATPRVRALTSAELAREGPSAHARIPSAAHRAAASGLERGPVLVQVPRTGYVPVVACTRCRTVATCVDCHGPLGLTGDRPAACRWCGRLAAGWRCAECGAGGLRSVRVGSQRTAEELGRAFPGAVVRHSGAGTGVLGEVPDSPALVVATPGAEPVAAAGYASALLLDAGLWTARGGLYAGEDAVRRWLAAAALVVPASRGGEVLLVGDGAPRPTQALVRWDPAGFAERELAERRELSLPPAVRLAIVTGSRDAVAAVLARLDLPGGARVLGPVEDETADSTLELPVRALLTAPIGEGPSLAATLAASLAVRSARRESGQVRVQLDPREVV